MKANIGKTDRIIRAILGIAIIGAGIYYNNWIAGVIGSVLLLTGLIGWCGLYQISGTCCPFSKNKEGKKGDKPQGGCCAR
jgi:hypothetical protein